MMNKDTLAWGITVVVAAFVCGCQQPEPETIELRTPRTKKTDTTGDKPQEETTWEDLTPDVSLDPRTRPRLVAASKAKPAPTLELERLSGSEVDIDVGQNGKVTIVLFWGMDSPSNQAAALHVSELVKMNFREGLRGITVVEKTPTGNHRKAPQFMRIANVDVPSYYDDFDAFNHMRDVADVDVERGIPSFFLVDRKGRIRLFKLGFSYTSQGVWGRGGTRPTISENAPEGKSIKDYVERLLDE